jgi:hypothetical protein
MPTPASAGCTWSAYGTADVAPNRAGLLEDDVRVSRQLAHMPGVGHGVLTWHPFVFMNACDTGRSVRRLRARMPLSSQLPGVTHERASWVVVRAARGSSPVAHPLVRPCKGALSGQSLNRRSRRRGQIGTDASSTTPGTTVEAGDDEPPLQLRGDGEDHRRASDDRDRHKNAREEAVCRVEAGDDVDHRY